MTRALKFIGGCLVFASAMAVIWAWVIMLDAVVGG